MARGEMAIRAIFAMALRRDAPLAAPSSEIKALLSRLGAMLKHQRFLMLFWGHDGMILNLFGTHFETISELFSNYSENISNLFQNVRFFASNVEPWCQI